MLGGTRKRGSTWSYYFDLGQIDGKRQKRERGGFKTKREAEAALTKAIAEYNRAGLVFEPSEITVADYLDQWYSLYCEPNLKYNTLLDYLRIMKNHLKPKFGIFKLRSITSALLQEYANELKLKGYSKRHLANILTVLGSALNYAVEPMHIIAVNPMRYVKYPKVEKKPRERIVFSLADWRRIIGRFPAGSRYHVPLMIGFYAGLRISEAFALTWDDIDLEARTLTVSKQVIKRDFGADVRKAVEIKGSKKPHSAWYFNTTKTLSSNRVIQFGDTLYNALKNELAAQTANEERYGDNYIIQVIKKDKDEKGNDLLQILPVAKGTAPQLPRVRMICVSENGEYTSTDSFKYCSRVIHKELQLAFDYHSLRHTHATLLIESGAHVKDVQKRLGHASIETTLQTYVHDTEAMTAQSVELFEKAVTQ